MDNFLENHHSLTRVHDLNVATIAGNPAVKQFGKIGQSSPPDGLISDLSTRVFCETLGMYEDLPVKTPRAGVSRDARCIRIVRQPRSSP